MNYEVGEAAISSRVYARHHEFLPAHIIYKGKNNIHVCFPMANTTVLCGN